MYKMPALAQGFCFLCHERATYLMRHNNRGQPEIVGRVECQNQRVKGYTVSVTPLALLLDREKASLKALLAPYQIKEVREQPQVIIFVDFEQQPFHEVFPENVITGVFADPSVHELF